MEKISGKERDGEDVTYRDEDNQRNRIEVLE